MDKLPGLGDMGGMLSQLRQLQGDLVKAQKELAKETVTAEVADGAIKIVITGDQRLTSLEISPEAAADPKLAELLMEGFNDALEASRQMAKDRLGPLSQGLNF
ncbi:MAG: YbaB/EbfC family nucleoid-associated protein [Anaerolineales bacterium]|nr:YbaB/EbfC family nucleoid-associated protein [Anaerolineales bacterium]